MYGFVVLFVFSLHVSTVWDMRCAARAEARAGDCKGVEDGDEVAEHVYNKKFALQQL